VKTALEPEPLAINPHEFCHAKNPIPICSMTALFQKHSPLWRGDWAVYGSGVASVPSVKALERS
jgi:hypothetical protein